MYIISQEFVPDKEIISESLSLYYYVNDLKAIERGSLINNINKVSYILGRKFFCEINESLSRKKVIVEQTALL